MTAVAIQFQEVGKQYGPLHALDRISLSVQRGEMFGMIGPDGAGKTTAIRLACGLLTPDAGSVRVLGHDPVSEHGAVTRLIGYLSQRFSLYGDLTIDENIAFQAEIHGVRRYQQDRDRLLAMTQLTPFRGRRADRLSGGMKQKLALACTLIHHPDVLLLDEPTTGVDPVSRREFWKLLSEFLAEGLTIVMATPYLDEAERCARVALLHGGRVIALDDPAVLQAALPGSLLEVIVDGPRPPLDALTAIEGVDDVQLFGDRAHVRLLRGTVADSVRLVTAGLERQGIVPTSVRAVPASLEDVFIDLVTRAGPVQPDEHLDNSGVTGSWLPPPGGGSRPAADFRLKPEATSDSSTFRLKPEATRHSSTRHSATSDSATSDPSTGADGGRDHTGAAGAPPTGGSHGRRS